MLFALVCLGLSATFLEIPLLGCTGLSNTMSSALLQSQDKLQLASSEYQKLQNDLQAIVDARQRLGAQQQENELVKKVSSTIDRYSNCTVDFVCRSSSS